MRRNSVAILVGLIAVVVSCVPSTPVSGALAGEVFESAEAPTIDFTVCNVANVTCEFSATGNATGPYPGQFSISGSFTYGDGDYGQNDGLPHAPIVAFDATFEIDGPSGPVTGQMALDPTFPAAGGASTVGARVDTLHFTSTSTVGAALGELQLTAFDDRYVPDSSSLSLRFTS